MPTDRRAPGRDPRVRTAKTKEAKEAKEAKAKEAKEVKEAAKEAKAKEAKEAKEVKEAAKEAKEAKPRKRERRMGDRRESPRLPIKVWVKTATAEGFAAVEGDISVGGLHFTDKLPITGKKIDLRFKLPGHDAEVHVKGEVVQVSQKSNLYGAHVRFGEMDMDTERAIARFIDERSS